jgi:serine/threonine-protein kinase
MPATLESITQALSGHYRVERELGAGGMATVYLAHDLRHDREVAVKVLRPELALALGADRFVREIRTIAQLQHPHILGLIDSGEVDGTAWYVMPFVRGESLRDRLNREKQLPVQEALRITADVASALDYAHRQGVIHRDIKPENILIHDGAALLADFGVALAAAHAAGDGRITESGISLGTPQYMSPEQALGERDIDARSDIFSLSTVTNEMLTGKPPFTGQNVQAIVAQLATEDPVPVSRVRRSVPDHVNDAILVALEKLPADRFATASHFAAALKGEVPVSRVDGGAGRMRAVRRWQILAATLAALTVIGFGAAAASRRTPGISAFAAALSLPENAPLDPRRANVAISPDGGTLVYVSSAEGESLFIRSLSSLVPSVIPRTRGATAPEFSPDGRWLSFLSTSPRRLMKMPFPPDGQPPTVVLDTVAEFSWGEKGVILFTQGRTTGLWVSTSEGRPRKLIAQVDTAGGVDSYSQPQLLPGARAAIFAMTASRLGVSQLAVVKLDDGVVQRLNVDGVGGRYLHTGHLLVVRADGSAAIVPFDLRALKVTGSPRVLLDSVLVQSGQLLDVSSSGTLAYISGQAFEELVRVDRRGSVTYVYGRQPGRFATPRFSPDCERVAVMAVLPGPTLRTDQLVFAPGAGRIVRLTDDHRGGTAAWIDGGRAVAWMHRAPAPGEPGAAMLGQSWDGSGARRVIREGGIGGGSITSTLDGSLLMYPLTASDGVGTDLYVFGADGGTPARQVNAPPGNKEGSTISPDGRWVAYAANDETGRYEIYVSPVQGNTARYRVTKNGGTEPAWAHDGLSLYYRSSFTGNANRVMMWDQPDWLLQAHLQFNPAPSTARIDSIFQNPYSRYQSSRYYDVCRDGSFAMLRSGAPQQRLVVIAGWLDQVRRQIAGAR